MKRIAFLIPLLLFTISNMSQSPKHMYHFNKDNQRLSLELLKDNLVRVEYYFAEAQREATPPTLMVEKKDYPGPTIFNGNGNQLETRDLKLNIDPNSLEISLVDKTKNNLRLTTLGAKDLDKDWKSLVATSSKELLAFGLGEQFTDTLPTQVSYNNKIREGSEFGNKMEDWEGGVGSNTQIPVLYALNKPASNENYAIFLDNVYKHKWDFTSDDHWEVGMYGDSIVFYIIAGDDLLDLRSTYMELVGHPLLPPKRMFGLVVSEYPYVSWEEVQEKLTTLRLNKFPIDVFVLDVNWYGGLKKDSSQIGRMAWDLRFFPDPKKNLKKFKEDHGVMFNVMNQTYVDKKIPEFKEYTDAGIMVLNPEKTSADIIPMQWWGEGGMLDYSNPKTGPYIFDNKIKSVIDDGILGFWIDLGEPEDYHPEGQYFNGKTQPDIHNLNNLLWMKEFYDGYNRHDLKIRPYFTSRSGTAGIQRYGVAMWSGDIGTKMLSLDAHSKNQVHMSFSGIDFYRSDAGGYWRNMNDPNQSYAEIYTKWYAQSLLFDIPIRVHVDNVNKEYETAPDRRGDPKSNLANTRLRYQMIPYYYTLAYNAHKYAAPVISPLIYHFQDDPEVVEISEQKMIGPYLMGCAELEYGRNTKSVYLPKGVWIDWHSGERTESMGEWKTQVPLYRNGLLTLPLYAKEGAIIPMQFVDKNTMNAVGDRLDGSTRNDLIVRVVPSSDGSQFELYEDDGATIAYTQDHIFRTTRITQKQREGQIEIVLDTAEGNYEMSEERPVQFEVLMAESPKEVLLNGNPIPKHGEPGSTNEEGYWEFKDYVLVITVAKSSILERQSVFINY